MFLLKMKGTEECAKFLGLYWAETSLELTLAALGTFKRECEVVSLLDFSFLFFFLFDTNLGYSFMAVVSCVPLCPGKQAAESHALSEVVCSGWEDSTQTQPRVQCCPEETHRQT